jgi:uncharacterized protein (DUF952 family)
LDIDLLFTAFKESDWRNISGNGKIEPDPDSKLNSVLTYTGEQAEAIINKSFEEEKQVLLIVFDPLRIQSPIKKTIIDGHTFIAIQGEVSLDAVIDKIMLKKGKNGQFSLKVKHFD